MIFKRVSKGLLFICIALLFLSKFGIVLSDDAPTNEFQDEEFSGNIVEDEESTLDTVKKYVPPLFQPPKVKLDSVHFVDWFNDAKAIGKKWIKSLAPDTERKDTLKYKGKWIIETPSKVILENDLGLVVKDASAHHAIAAQLAKPFSFDGKPLVVQYDLKFQDGQVCGGGYVKLLSDDSQEALDKFHDKTPYTIMFGPDKCGQNSKVHLIIRHRNPVNGSISEHHAKATNKPTAGFFEKEFTHLYTLIINPTNTYQVFVDNAELMSGSLLNDLEPSIVPPKQIADPEEKRPEDWDERPKIPDPEAKKPADWDESQPKEILDNDATKPSDWLEEEKPLIPDPKAVKPADWDTEMDGEWEANLISNPECEGRSGCGKWTPPMKQNPLYKGRWVAPQIDNPAFKGYWKPRLIDNPNYFEADPYHQLASIRAIGIELWTISNELLFDNIIVTDNLDLARKFAEETFNVKADHERLYNQIVNPTKSILDSFWALTDQYPWLLPAILIVAVLLLVGLSVFCFGRKSAEAPHTKKTDAVHMDDVSVEDEAPEEEEDLIEYEEVEIDDTTKSTKSPSAKARKPSLVEVESDEAASTADFATVASPKKTTKATSAKAPEVKQPEPSSPSAGPTTRRARIRRQE